MKIEWQPIEICDTNPRCCSEKCPYLEKGFLTYSGWNATPRCYIFGRNLTKIVRDDKTPGRCIDCLGYEEQSADKKKEEEEK